MIAIWKQMALWICINTQGRGRKTQRKEETYQNIGHKSNFQSLHDKSNKAEKDKQEVKSNQAANVKLRLMSNRKACNQNHEMMLV